MQSGRVKSVFGGGDLFCEVVVWGFRSQKNAFSLISLVKEYVFLDMLVVDKIRFR